MFRRMSLRARITAGSVLVALVVFGVALVAVRAGVAGVLDGANETLASGDLTSFVADILANPDEKVDDPGTGVLVYVRDPDGVVQVDTMPHDIDFIVRHRAGADESFTTTTDEAEQFAIVGRTVPTTNGTWSLWAARSTASSALSADNLGHLLLIGAVVLLAVFGIASWLLATAALRPVERMRRQAETLGTEAGGGRLPVGDANDELDQLARTLNTFLDDVHRSAERERQVVSDAAHELRTPLAVLKTRLELAHDDFGDADLLAARVVEAEASVERLSSLATNLLELSRLDADTVHAARGATPDIVAEAMAAVDRGRLLALSSGSIVDIDFDAPGQQNYAVSPVAFGRVVDNLVANALAAGAPVVAVTLRQGETLELTVADSGPGMPDDFVPRAFERFSRPDDARGSGSGGSGLGLALVSAIVEAADGRIILDNSPAGLTVKVILPSV